jgi:hypothetical protein
MKYVLAILFSLAVQSLNAQTEFSQENATTLLKHLCIDIGPRPMGSPAEHQAMEYALQKFKEYGCDTAYVMHMDATSRVNTNSGIAIGIKRGATKRMIVIGGHIDSVAPEVPGADDDGSGSATVMECARILGKRKMQSTILFCCWGGEEQGLEGSKYFVEHFSEMDSIALMLQVDMANGQGLIELDPDTHGHSAPQWLTRATIEEFYALGYDHLRYPTHFFAMNYARGSGSGSDHESFLQYGIPAIDLSTDVSKPIHTPRDNYENFDPSGLKRSGDVILKLVDRFDNGVPARTTEHYWLYVLGKTPIFIPFWGLWTFFGITFFLAIVAVISVRSRRQFPNSPERIRWSAIKLLLYTFIIVSCGWFSSNIIGVIKGYRYPWMTAIPSYYLLAFFGIIIGCWLALQLNEKLKLSKCPYLFFMRSVICLLIGTIIFGFINIKLMVEPMTALLFISLAILVRQPITRLILLGLSPWWMFRIPFSEWSDLLFRTGAIGLPTSFTASLFINELALTFFTLYLLPLVFGAAAIMRDSPELSAAIPKFKSGTTVLIALAAGIIWGGYLIIQPVYDQLWYRDVRANERYDMNQHSKEISITSNEYLNGLHVTHDGKNIALDGRIVNSVIESAMAFDTTWLSVNRSEKKEQSGELTKYRVELTLSANRRPYTVSVTYSGGKNKLISFDTKLYYRNMTEGNRIDWFSFPDSILNIPVEFQITGNDSVKEKIEVTFDKLADPMEFQRELTYVIPRTSYINTFIYKK